MENTNTTVENTLENPKHHNHSLVTSTNTKNPKPFFKYSFYLDMKNSSQLNSILTEKIVQLGGKIDHYITKHTSCVVTNRPKNDWLHPQSLDTTDSPTPKFNNAAFSRGLQLLEKTNQTFKPLEQDALDIARNLNIKILRSAKLLKFCDEHLEARSKQESSSRNNFQPRTLSTPFIKIIDISYKYKPTYKEYNHWPEINLDYIPELCPFFKGQPTKTSPAITADNKMVNDQVPFTGKPDSKLNSSFRQLQSNNKSTTTTTAQKQLNDRCTQLTTPILTTTTIATVTNNISITTPATNNINNTNQNKNQTTQKKRHLTYCEICHKDYSDFETHLADPQHDKFMNNDENYNELLGVISSLRKFVKVDPSGNKPNNSSKQALTDFTNLIPVISKEGNHESYSGSSNKNSPPQNPKTTKSSPTIDYNLKFSSRNKNTPSPPNTAAKHSLNALSSASKNNSFLPIHTLIHTKQLDN